MPVVRIQYRSRLCWTLATLSCVVLVLWMWSNSSHAHDINAVVSGAGGWLSNTYLFFGLLLVLLVLSGLFSGSEIALVSLSPARVRAMVEAGMVGSGGVSRLKAQPNRMLITILLGNNLVNIGASVMAAAWTSTVFGSAALGVATALLTLLVLIFGEIFPKAYAQRHAEGFACALARPIMVLQLLLYPVVRLLERVLQFALKHVSGKRARIDARDELRAMVDVFSEEGRIEDSLQHLMSGSFAFGQKKVSDIMTPRSNIVAIEESATLHELRKLFISSSRSRIPVYRKTLDDVRGIATLRMLLRAEEAGKRLVGEANLLKPVVVRPVMAANDLTVR